MQLNGAEIVIECLKEQGVDTVFGYPGGAILNVYDELYKHRDEIRHILTSHEQGAAHAADGYARATGKVGVCLATSGPGATNLVTGIATAYMDSIPVVAITCNVGVPLLGKDSFQEIDGLAGNDALGERFPYRSIVAMGEESGFYYNWNSQGKGPKITTYGNPNATWEEAKKLDVGLELGLFNALNIEAAYFTEDRTGIFMRRTSLPSSTGLLGVTPYGNIGRVKSHGVDLSAVYNKQFNKDWSLSLRGTFTFSRNEVVEKDEGDLMYDYMSVVGHPVNAITGVLVADGLFTSQEEIDNSPKQQFGNYTVGDIKYRDLNGDGIVDGNDVTTAGSPTVPEIQYGIGATVKWRRLDFSFMFQGASNVSLRMYNMHPFCDASHFGYGITQYIADNHWSEDNNRADAAYPRLTSQLSSNNTQSSTFYIHDAKYLRLKTVELGYTIKKLRVYLSGNNLFVISPFDYWDPEKGGGHGLSYPLQRTAKIGVQYQF